MLLPTVHFEALESQTAGACKALCRWHFQRICRVERRQEKGRIVAALSFPGIPLDWEVLAAERKLRGLLLIDGLSADDTYMLARYNEPFVPPPFKRNEVLIELKDSDSDGVAV